MGIGIVLIFWGIVGVTLAAVGGAVMAAIAGALTRGRGISGKSLVLAAALFPASCVGWAAGLFIVQAIVNEVVFDRDPGLGDGWHTPLPNGYAIEFIDVTDHGWVINPKTQSPDVISETGDSVADVRQLQISGSYMLGATDSKVMDFSEDVNRVDGFFLINTKNATKETFKSLDELKSAATKVGVTVQLEPIYNVYARYRGTWFDWLIGIVFVSGPLLGFVLLVWWLMRVRRAAVQPILATT